MNWTDYIIIGVLGLSIVVGLWRGLVAEVLSLIIWVAAFWAAWVFGPLLAVRLEPLVRQPSVRIIGAYALCFVAVLIFGMLLRFVARRLVYGMGLAGPDRILGGLFGFVRGVLLITLVVFLVGFTAFTHDPWWQRSILLPHFRQAAVWLEQRTPVDVGKYLHPERVLEHLPRLHALTLNPILTLQSAMHPVHAASIHAAGTVPAGSASSRTRHP
ncbi:MAG: CvpA family protein [Rhodanobacter sp.]